MRRQEVRALVTSGEVSGLVFRKILEKIDLSFLKMPILP